jgi:protein disulfide-isomerase A6
MIVLHSSVLSLTTTFCYSAKGDQLGDEFAGSSSVVIGDVDCTAEGESLCTKMEVRGYPSIKFWKDGTMEDYQGGRDFDSLKQHVVDNLQVLCDVTDPKDCTDKEKAYIEKMKAKAQDEIEKQHARLDGMKGDTMKAELKQWLHQRLNILKGLKEKKEEL